jgi:hypothetical protein
LYINHASKTSFILSKKKIQIIPPLCDSRFSLAVGNLKKLPEESQGKTMLNSRQPIKFGLLAVRGDLQ